METRAQLTQLVYIVQSTVAPVLDAFDQSAMAAKSPGLGGSRTLIIQRQIATEYASKLLRALWDDLERALNRTHLEWKDETVADLIGLVETELGRVCDRLYTHVKQKAVAYPSEAAAASDGIDAAVETHLGALRAQIALYVFDRRRKEIVDLLNEFGRRLAVVGTNDQLAIVLRDAKREAETPNPDPGRLKSALESLSTTVQALPAALDLGDKLAKILATF